ncbi:hypothetical protein [Caudoviricetes sp.]|nr:hypothetical protein [Caudoviricetes sp.]
MNPFTVSKFDLEELNQEAIFIVLGVMAEFGWNAAVNPQSYSVKGYAKRIAGPVSDFQRDALRATYAVPNGAHLARGAFTGAKLKAQGMRVGIPDICVPAQGPEGQLALYVELKKAGGKETDSQKEMIPRLTRLGNQTIVCIGWFDAVKVIADYLGF